MNTPNLALRLPLYKLHVPIMPTNYTLGLTYRCNSRCKTCRVYEKEKACELSVAEWQRVFKSLGNSPYWVTFTGGEPFLYDDLLEVCWNLVETCHPKMINIPTNGLLVDKIEKSTWQMCKMASKTLFTVNVSIDHIGEKDDEIRGVPGAYEKAIETIKRLQHLQQENLKVGIHTVVSKFNVDEFSWVSHILSKLVEHSLYITEVAENRNELYTMFLDIAPTQEQYTYAINCINTGAGIKGFLRSRYYRNTLQWLKSKKRIIPCYAGHTSCQITPDGNVWFCCVNAKSVGNVREHDFRDIWRGKKANELRKDTTCSCPLANASYTNMILSPWSLL